MLPSLAGLLEGKSCFASSFLGVGAAYSLAARPNIASAIEEKGHDQTQPVAGGRGLIWGVVAGPQLASTSFVAEQQVGSVASLLVIQSSVPFRDV